MAAAARLPAFAAASPAQPQTSTWPRGEASYAAVCAACHAADGNSPSLQPSLAQQHPEYLVKQLMEFKSGKRVDPRDVGFGRHAESDDMRNIAAWLASQRPSPVRQGQRPGALGERIYAWRYP